MWRKSGQKALELGGDVSLRRILLDVRLPDLSGIEVCRELRQRGYRVSRDDAYSAGFGRAAGRRLGCRCRRLSHETLRLGGTPGACAGARSRGFHSTNAKLRYADLTLDRHRRRATRDKGTIPLTSREFALLELLLLRAPELITRSEIVEHVWDCTSTAKQISLRFISIGFVRRLIKIGSVKLIHTVRGVGYRLGCRGHESQNPSSPDDVAFLHRRRNTSRRIIPGVLGHAGPCGP